MKPTSQNFIFFYFFYRFVSQCNYRAYYEINCVLCHRRIISRRSRVTHATAPRYFVSPLSSHRLASPVLFLRRASRHVLFSINAVPLRDTSHVSRVTLCRFRGISYYFGVISCLVTTDRAIPLCCPARSSRRSFLRVALSTSLLSHSSSYYGKKKLIILMKIKKPLNRK